MFSRADTGFSAQHQLVDIIVDPKLTGFRGQLSIFEPSRENPRHGAESRLQTGYKSDIADEERFVFLQRRRHPRIRAIKHRAGWVRVAVQIVSSRVWDIVILLGVPFTGPGEISIRIRTASV